MNNYFNEGIAFFEKNEYDLAIQYFIKAYMEDDNRESILRILYECYHNPNEAEFRKNYQYNAEEISKLPYEELAIDFFPVSETKFYLFDKINQTFIGEWDMESIIKQSQTESRELEFSSVLVANYWDLQEILGILRTKRWEVIYWVLNEKEKYFSSFLKLPQMKDGLLKNVIVIPNDDILKIFFETYTDFYLPKYIIAEEQEKYKEILGSLHRKRIEDTQTDRNNVLLSICIPTYKRGETAYKNVLSLLELPYDSEIEIVVSNNGTKDVYYDMIGEIKDSRLKYHAFEENQHFRPNVIKTLELAKGKFAIMTSDEDFLINGTLEDFLKYLINHPDYTVIKTSGYGSNFTCGDSYVIPKGESALFFAMNLNYMTGLCYNKSLMMKYNILERLGILQNNLYYDMYPHCVVAMYMVNIGPVAEENIKLWESKKETAATNMVIAYMWLNSRIEQKETCLEICDFLLESSLERVILERSQKTYFLLALAFMSRYEEYSKYYSWRQICYALYQSDRKCIEKYSKRISDIDNLKVQSRKIFLRWLMDEQITENRQILNKLTNEIIKEKIIKDEEIDESIILNYEQEVEKMLEHINL